MTGSRAANPPIPVVYSATHLDHDISTGIEWGVTSAAYEVAERAEAIRSGLAAIPAEFVLHDAQSFGETPLTAVHEPGLVRFLADAWSRFQLVRPQREVFPDTFMHPSLRERMAPLAEPSSVQGGLGYWCWETMTPLVEGTYAAARGAVDVALTATEFVLDGADLSYALCRPPGHHAPRASYGGYCYFNNAAISAQMISAQTGAKVTVLDVDYHHGNGTQQIFYDRADVQYVSIHADPARAYPYLIGFADEVGTGAGLGTTTNLPLAAGTDDDAYLHALDQACAAIDRFGPDAIVVSLGVDTAVADPLGDFAITPDGFAAQGRRIAGLGRPTVVVQEGGYLLPMLAANVTAFLRGCARR